MKMVVSLRPRVLHHLMRTPTHDTHTHSYIHDEPTPPVTTTTTNLSNPSPDYEPERSPPLLRMAQRLTPLHLFLLLVAAAAEGPCDIYDAAPEGTPCIAAHSTVRALYAAYAGPLYQVKRSTDNRTKDVAPISAGGLADSASQDAFCGADHCVIWRIYDQSTQKVGE